MLVKSTPGAGGRGSRGSVASEGVEIYTSSTALLKVLDFISELVIIDDEFMTNNVLLVEVAGVLLLGLFCPLLK